MERNRRGRPRHPDVLTPAEWRVLDALREGGTNAEIAARLGLSADTVKTHISNMLAKLELRDRRALAAWRPDAPRRRLGGVLAVPAALWSVGRPLVWVGAGVAALAGVAVVVVALVALEVIVEGDPAPPAAVTPPPASTQTSTPMPGPTASPTASPTPTATVAPTATPTATPVPSPTATPVPSPTATPPPAATAPAAASACVGIECIEPAPGAFVHETWESGEQIDSPEWGYGFFFLDIETGRTEGYRGTDWIGGPDVFEYRADGVWLKWHGLLINRETGKAWRWPENSVEILAMSEQHVFVVERTADGSYARFSLLDSDAQLVGDFTHDSEGPNLMLAFFSPDGRAIALIDRTVAHLIDVESGSSRVLLDQAEREGWQQGVTRVETAYRGPGFLVQRRYSREADDSDEVRGWEHSTENWYFTWDGDPLPGREQPFWTDCEGRLSPDGRYIALAGGGPVGLLYHEDWMPIADPWPSVVIAAARTCEPLFRVRSALVDSPYFFDTGGSWLSDSSAYVLVVNEGGMMVRLSGDPQLVALPSRGGRLVAAPAGGRYFANSSGAWDSTEDRWILFESGPEALLFHWSADGTEILYVSTSYQGEGGAHHLLLQPKIEFPPFSDEIAFRARGGDETCEDLRDQPQTSGAIVGCVSSGARLALAEPDDPPTEGCGLTCYPSARATSDGWFVYVRTEDGVEGWISLESLEHD